MSLKNKVVTILDNEDFFIYDEAVIDNDTCYMMFKIINGQVSNEAYYAKDYNNTLEIISNEFEVTKIADYFLQDNLNKIHHVPTPHIKANYNEIAPLVLMPGDPLRAKQIADTYLSDVKLVSDVRNIYAYTGFYNNTRVTIMAAGMGMPSAGIYYHELFKFYDVKKIIRIGTCGGTIKEEKLLDLVIADKAFTTSNFAYTYTTKESYMAYPSKNLTDNLVNSAKEKQIDYHLGGVFTMDFFGPYINTKPMYDVIPKDFNLMAEEMECFGLLLIANTLGKEAACILTVVDSPFIDTNVSSDDREKGMGNMIKVALDAIIK